ncbi:MAG: hypothetical protein KIT83_06240 [Bryobacterales bacterium]|nr:hypothetical protein [Bryobacterales bacterium]
MSHRKELDRIGLLIDAASDAGSEEELTRASLLLDGLVESKLASSLGALTHYFRANIWSTRGRIGGSGAEWNCHQTELQNELLELRRAITHPGFPDLSKLRKCQIYTNLANGLSFLGRFIEAVEMWDRAIALIPRFAAANGNRAIAFCHYGYSLYDPGHAELLIAAANDGFAQALADEALYEGTDKERLRVYFAREWQALNLSAEHYRCGRLLLKRRYSHGRSKSERAYRQWCLRQRLFLNPLNDTGPSSIAARDILTLPTIVAPIEPTGCGPPAAIGFFNQMKQEFVSARYLCYEALQPRPLHFSDRDVLLYDTWDDPAYALATEKLRMSFRMAYSLFDKIAHFLNAYFELGRKGLNGSFRKVWLDPTDRKGKVLAPAFTARENWPLRGLYWLSKDLFEDGFQEAMEPDAAELNDIRNHLEHKYLQLHMEGPLSVAKSEQETLRRSLTVEEFEEKTILILKLARAALIYLSLSVHREEQERNQKRSPGKMVAPAPLEVMEDRWNT